MRAERQRLKSLIESVADGDPLDWEALQQGADPNEQRLIGNLRLVANIADVHRTVVEPEATQWSAVARPALTTERWGHLSLVEKIGEGAFGEVYRAHDAWLDREVALKLLKPDVSARVSPTRLLNEARRMARVRHPNVVTVFGADVQDGRVGVWMELVRGRTLAQMLSAQGVFSDREAAGIGQDVCRALAAVHAAGLVHRDVKAQNVMRESGGRVVLMDFGAGGTPIYLAPEVLAGAEPTPAADIYAVGVLLFHLVTSHFPVTGSSLAELQSRHSSGRVTRLADRRTDIPDAFVRVIERALAKDPNARYSTVGEMLEALSTVAAPLPPVPAPAPLPTRVIRWRWPVAAMLALSLVAAGVTWRWPFRWPAVADLSQTTNGLRMVAILPLRTDDSAAQYFADGMTEALQQGLSLSRALRVLSRTSVDRAREREATLPAMARLLGADVVLEGSVTRANDRVRVSLRLIHAGSDTAIWSRTFDEALGNVFSLQDAVARAVADELNVRLESTTAAGVGSRFASIAPAGQPATEAYEEYLRGRFEYRRQTPQSVQAALEHFQKALALDPADARALSASATAYLALGTSFAAMPEAEAAALAREAAGRALDLAPNLAEAHIVRARIAFLLDWNFAEADTEFRAAIGLDPSLVSAREHFADFLISRGRQTEAFAQLAEARRLDPLSATLANRAASAYYYARQFDLALAEIDRAVALDANSVAPRVGRGRVLGATNRHQEAITAYEEAIRASSDHPFYQSEIAQSELALGLVEPARRRITRLETSFGTPGSRVTPYMLALAYARLDLDRAFQWLDRDVDARSARVLWLLVDPRVEPLKTDPRYRTALERLGLNP